MIKSFPLCLTRWWLPSCLLVLALSLAVAFLWWQPRLRAAGDCTVAAQELAIDAEEERMLTLINQYRQQNGAGALTASIGLTRSASWMSRDMAAKGYFAHDDSLGRSPFERMADCGYSSTAMGENVGRAYGYGTTTVDIVFSGWRNSPSHNETLLNPAYRAAGIARACSSSGCYWTLDVGAHIDTAVTTGNSGATAAILPPVGTLAVAPTPSPSVSLNITSVGREGPSSSPLMGVVGTPGNGMPALPIRTDQALRPVSLTADRDGWIDAPVASRNKRRICPVPGSWAFVYWDGRAVDIATAASLCPGADRYWSMRGERWFGYRPGNVASDRWTVEPGEAVFAYAP